MHNVTHQQFKFIVTSVISKAFNHKGNQMKFFIFILFIFYSISSFAQTDEEKLIEFFEKYKICIFNQNVGNGNPCVDIDTFLESSTLNDITYIKVYDYNYENLIIGGYFKEITFPKEIELLTNLQTIVFDFEVESSINGIENFKNLKKLVSIGLSLYKNKEIPKEIFDLTSLKSLYFLGEELESIPNEIGKLTSLNSLSIWSYMYGKITSIPDEIEKLKNLESLTLMVGKGLENLNEKIFNLTNLKTLDLSNNNISYIDEDINNLINLETLNLSDNNIYSLDGDIDKLTNLKNLNLSKNKLTNFNEKILNLNNLAYCDLSFNQIDYISFENVKDINLSILNISNNNIQNINIDKLFKMTNLVELDLSGNNLHGKLKNISNAKNLHRLLLQGSNLFNSDLVDITKASNLTTLYLDSNNIEVIPPSIGDLKQLFYLNLDSNKIKVLPKELKYTNSKPLYQTIYNFSIPIKLGLSVKNNQISLFSKDLCDVNFSQLYIYNNLSTLLPECIKNKTYGWIYNDIDWNFYKLQIGYEYLEDNQTISFYPILGDDYNITSYFWDFGDGNYSTLKNPTYKFANYGDYNISLKIISKDGNIITSKILTYKEKVLKIKKGWNLLATPTKDDIETKNFPDSFEFWFYQKNKWSNPTIIAPTQGFWVNADRDFDYYYEGESYKLQDFYIKEIYNFIDDKGFEFTSTGWNLLGSGEKYELNENYINYHYKDEKWFQTPIIDIGEGVWVKKR